MSLNEEIHDLRERNADLADEAEYWRIACGNWRSRAEDAERRLESALAGLKVFQGELRELNEERARLFESSQALLGHALGVKE